jgi:D-alanyl-D-alanine carboxypeptidase
MKMNPLLAFYTALILCLSTGCGSDSRGGSTVEARMGGMVAAKYAAYKAANGLPDNAGLVVHLQTPTGSWTASAGLPAGADETWHYRVASVSKTFTAAAIMLLDQQGRLHIDDPLTAPIPGSAQPYLPASPNYAIPHKGEITIRQLLSHRAGVFDLFNNPVPASSPFPYAGKYYNNYVYDDLQEPDHQFTLDELAGVVAANNLSSGAPDSGYSYSDTGYTLLAKIIERVSGRSYDRFLEENFFTPLGLSRTSAPWNGSDIALPQPFLRGYSSGGDGVFFETTEDNMSSQVGPGNIISTPHDMARWIRALLSGRGPLSPVQVARMTTVPSGNTTYALGIGRNDLGLGHSGAHPGYVNLVVYDPVDDVALVVATPFIDYTKLNEHLALMVEVGSEARKIAGYGASMAFP